MALSACAISMKILREIQDESTGNPSDMIERNTSVKEVAYKIVEGYVISSGEKEIL